MLVATWYEWSKICIQIGHQKWIHLQRQFNEKDPVWNTAIPTAKGNFIQLVTSHNIHEGENLPLTELPPTLKVNTLGLLGNY